MRRRTPFHSICSWKTARQLAKVKAGLRCERCGYFRPVRVNCIATIRCLSPSILRWPRPLNFMVLCPACHNIEEPRTGDQPLTGAAISRAAARALHPWNMRP